MYIHYVESENHNVATIIQNVAQNKKEKIQNIASDIMNGDIVDAPQYGSAMYILYNII